MDTNANLKKDPSMKIPGVNFYEKRPRHRNAGGNTLRSHHRKSVGNETYETKNILKSFKRTCVRSILLLYYTSNSANVSNN